MGRPETHEITQLLDEWGKGSPQALEALTPLVYPELKQLAAAYLRKEKYAQTLQPTALVHEAYLKLVAPAKRPSWQNRAHFYGVAARLMRQILVDYARKRKALKRVGISVSVEAAVGNFKQGRAPDLLALDMGLTALEKIDPRKSRVVELRYFGGLSLDEIAQSLEVSLITVRRDLKMAEAWLFREMQGR
jgi:RNA polymerase sigma-70 factor (ECF subfamily)